MFYRSTNFSQRIETKSRQLKRTFPQPHSEYLFLFA